MNDTERFPVETCHGRPSNGRVVCADAIIEQINEALATASRQGVFIMSCHNEFRPHPRGNLNDRARGPAAAAHNPRAYPNPSPLQDTPPDAPSRDSPAKSP